ncbi:secretin N-terminal domain-containing protein [Tsuneonella mangrovi]|uniref:secretin N-terminal domain-containing protein n=1 Tax=Tsuneonella mangrovi TaxID=1982042 RepID=UPI000BA1C443|nr:secretin N-terminal domain-containing protein [Tsuneonella mangrovi]
MLMQSRPIPALLVALLASLLILVATAADAQPSQVLVSQAKLVDGGADETRLTLDVEGILPVFTLATNDGPRVELVLADARRGGGATLANTETALVRDVEFHQDGRNLRVIVTGKTGLHAATVAENAHRVSLILTPTEPLKSNSVTSNDNGPAQAAATPPPGLNWGDHYELVPLKYADVSEVVGMLTQGSTVKPNDTFIPREPAFGSNSLTGNNYSSNFQPQQSDNSDQPLGESVNDSIAIDRRLNAVWLRGTPEHIAELKAMIKKIDVPVDSVILETELVELTETGAKAVGIDFTNASGQIAVATLQSGQYIPYGIPPSDGGHQNDAFQVVGGHLTSTSLQAAIYAQVSKGNGKIVSRPRISAQSGSTAKIITGDALPILTAITLSGVNGVSQQVQYVNVGVTLQIAPRVSSDGYVTSHVFCVVSSVSGFSQGYPTISQREAETSASVRDGESFIIGGLTQDSTLTTKTKIPLLGDIPVLGQAFRTDKKTTSRTELYIVVTPHVVRHGARGITAASIPAPVRAELPAAAVPQGQ